MLFYRKHFAAKTLGLVLVITAIGLSGCASFKPKPTSGGSTDYTVTLPPPPPPPVASEPVAPTTPDVDNAASQPRVPGIKILFGTDRLADVKSPGGFGYLRNKELTLGEAYITIPPQHSCGRTERPTVLFTVSLERENGEKHLVLKRPLTILSEDEFRAAIEAYHGEQSLLFVHGYNTTFEAGLYRTAQLANDFNIKGPVFHYSWPSRGKILAYNYDYDSVRISEKYFQHYLTLITSNPNVKNLTIIAHSKGNDLVLESLARMARAAALDGSRRQGPRDPFDQLILASPDLAEDLAHQLIPEVTPMFKGVTLYANNRDIPLFISRFVNGLNFTPRAGQLSSDGLPLREKGVDSIDGTAGDFAFLSLKHDAYVADQSLRNDVRKLIQTGIRPPEQRSPGKLIPIPATNPDFWRLILNPSAPPEPDSCQPSQGR